MPIVIDQLGTNYYAKNINNFKQKCNKKRLRRTAFFKKMFTYSIKLVGKRSIFQRIVLRINNRLIYLYAYIHIHTNNIKNTRLHNK